MSSLNRVYLIGNLTRDPEVRHTTKGMAVCDLAMAINSTYKLQDGTDREETVYVDVVVWNRQAETCAQYLGKGSPIFVEGRLQLDQWEDKDKQKKSRIKIRAERVQFLGRGKNHESHGGESQGDSRPPYRPETSASGPAGESHGGSRPPYRPAPGSAPARDAGDSYHHDQPPHHDEDQPF